MKFMLIKFAPERVRAAVFQLHLTAEQKAQLPLNTLFSATFSAAVIITLSPRMSLFNFCCSLEKGTSGCCFNE